tara:strand:- start:1477 stop:1740 length:264 start_codon:yes stop_codon:yes gene_type:complete
MNDEPYEVEPKKDSNARVNYRYVTEVMGVPLRWFMEFVEHVNDCVELSVVLDKVIKEIDDKNEEEFDKLEEIAQKLDRFRDEFYDKL